MAEGFIAECGKVVVVGRRVDPLASLASEHPDVVSMVQADISNPEDVRAVVKERAMDGCPRFGQPGNDFRSRELGAIFMPPPRGG